MCYTVCVACGTGLLYLGFDSREKSECVTVMVSVRLAGWLVVQHGKNFNIVIFSHTAFQSRLDDLDHVSGTQFYQKHILQIVSFK